MEKLNLRGKADEAAGWAACDVGLSPAWWYCCSAFDETAVVHAGVRVCKASCTLENKQPLAPCASAPESERLLQEISRLEAQACCGTSNEAEVTGSSPTATYFGAACPKIAGDEGLAVPRVREQSPEPV